MSHIRLTHIKTNALPGFDAEYFTVCNNKLHFITALVNHLLGKQKITVILGKLRAIFSVYTKST